MLKNKRQMLCKFGFSLYICPLFVRIAPSHTCETLAMSWGVGLEDGWLDEWGNVLKASDLRMQY